MTRSIEDEILRLCANRGAGKTICPSEVARSLAGNQSDWRRLMPDVRKSAAGLASCGRIEITQKRQPVDALSARGPIRLGLPAKAR